MHPDANPVQFSEYGIKPAPRRLVLGFLQQHPFAVEACFERSVVLAYALPPERLRPLVPKCLELDTFVDAAGTEWAFLAVAMVKTRDLRPAGFPRWLGRDFSLLGYRVFVRYRDTRGRRLRGLYILRSETDRRSMVWSGNLFTRYNYQLTDVGWEIGNGHTRIRSQASGLDVAVAEPGPDQECPLPAASPFGDWRTARGFAGPMPFTFSLQPGGQRMVIIEGVRSNWDPQPLRVDAAEVGFLAELGLEEARLANAFVVTDIPYRWEKGRIEAVPAEAAPC